MRETKRAYGWPEDAQFLVPDGVPRALRRRDRRARGRAARRVGAAAAPSYHREHETLRPPARRRCSTASSPTAGTRDIPSFEADAEGHRDPQGLQPGPERDRRRASPGSSRGSADLTDSTSVRLDFEGAGDFEPGDRDGRQLHYGIREHESAAISNGLSLVEDAALVVDLPDLLRLRAPGDPALGADGAAGDPHLHPRLDRPRRGRADPPAGRAARLAAGDPGPDRDPARDANEVAEAWRCHDRADHQPVALVLTRQNVPILDRSRYAAAEGLRRGAYVLADATGDPELILIATGSEVALALEAHEQLSADGVRARVVSMPSLRALRPQDRRYRDEVLPPRADARGSRSRRPRRSAGTATSGRAGAMIGMHTFGSSAPLKDLLEQVRLHPGGSCRNGARGARAGGGRMKATAELHDLGQSLWVDNITRDDARRRHARGLHRRALGHRADLEPDDLRQGDRRRRRLRRADRRASRARARGRGDVLRARARRPAPRRRAVQAGPRAHRRRRRQGLARGLAAARRRRRGDDRAGGRALRQGRGELLHQDPGHRGGPAGDRGDDLRRDPGQRHAAVLDRALPRRRRRLHARDRAPDRGRAEPERRLGRLAVHQPLGRRDRRRGSRPSSRTSSGSRSAATPTPPIASCSTPTACAAARQRGRAPAAAADGRAPGPRIPRPPTSSTSSALAAPLTVNTMPEKTLLAFAEHGERRAARCRPTAATPPSAWTRSRPPGSTSARSALASRRRARSRSTPPGAICSARSASSSSSQSTR